MNVPVAETYIPNNLGVVIKACRLLDFYPIIAGILRNEELHKQTS